VDIQNNIGTSKEYKFHYF